MINKEGRRGCYHKQHGLCFQGRRTSELGEEPRTMPVDKAQGKKRGGGAGGPGLQNFMNRKEKTSPEMNIKMSTKGLENCRPGCSCVTGRVFAPGR